MKTRTRMSVFVGLLIAFWIGLGGRNPASAQYSVHVCGSNGSGQLGDGRLFERPVPGQVLALGGVLAVSSGNRHSVALRADGTVWAWGENSFGQLGGGGMDTDVHSSAQQVVGLAGVLALSAGGNHNLALCADGTVWAWGQNSDGELGNGSTNDSAIPVQVSGLTNVQAIAAGGHHSLALASDGTVWAWGSNLSGQLGDSSNSSQAIPVQVTGLAGVTALAAGGFHSLALKADGTVCGWGENSSGQLGNGGNVESNVPVAVSGLSAVTKIACGEFHSLALKADGTVCAWGENSSGQLGNGTTNSSHIPILVVGLSGVTAIAGSYDNSYAIKSQDTVCVWGENGFGQLGNGTVDDNPHSVPVQVPQLAQGARIAAGDSHCLVVKQDGTIWTWGENGAGQLGDGLSVDFRALPFQLPALSDVVSFAGGQDHSLALTRGGQVWVWGDNTLSQLGIAGVRFQSSPFLVSGLTGVVAIATGDAHSLVLRSDGTVWAWGQNGSGQLGNGSLKLSSTPVQVVGLTDVIAIACGGNHSLAMTRQGVVWAWGQNGRGQLGDGTTLNRKIPVKVLGLSNIVSLVGGATHSLALGSDGTVWSWGSNQFGQLGRGTIDHSSHGVPLPIAGLASIKAIQSGANHSLALTTLGAVWAWGQNGSGQLGDGSTLTRSLPVLVLGLTSVVALAGGEKHSSALTAQGQVWTWGASDFGQLGTGVRDSDPHPLPVQVSNLGNVQAIASGGNHNLVLTKDTTSVSGMITLEACLSENQEVTCEFRPRDGSSVFTLSAHLGMDGSFTLAGIPYRVYDVHIKGKKWLAKNIVVDASLGAVNGVSVFLSVGDVNDDNYIGLDDLGSLALAFDTKPGDELWDERADLNCDGVVGLDDLGYLSLNFDTAGDP